LEKLLQDLTPGCWPLNPYIHGFVGDAITTEADVIAFSSKVMSKNSESCLLWQNKVAPYIFLLFSQQPFGILI